MIKLSGEEFYTLDEVAVKSGYAKGTLYNLTTAGILSPPIRGLDSSVYNSQGLYRKEVFNELNFYQQQKLTGKTKREICLLLQTRRACHEPILPILEG